ncbi:MAG: glycerol-3-phosphate 1-O-acyltransferase PlsY [Thiotrichaceae bacterium]|nr:glycerol-3-phosphate 1-O-acyltransferase PlsY [Thiotrichaceae bacterium]
MLNETLATTVIVGAYLLGSVSAAIIVCKLMGLADPRTVGSKNPGATNVLRLGGKKAAILTLVGDMLKGLFPPLIALMLDLGPVWVAGAGLAAFMGHLYPVFFDFKGGKGIATALGVFLAINFMAGLMVIATWLIVAKGLKTSSAAGLVASLLAPLYFYFMTHHWNVVWIVVIISVFIFLRHRSNIENLIKGTEDKISSKNKDTE